MKPSTFTDTQELLLRHSSRTRAEDKPLPEKTEQGGNYPRELNKGGILVSVAIVTVAMLILLVMTV